MTVESPSRQSPLHAQHLRLGAKLIDFHGWMLPVQYSSIIEEHQATRRAAGLFDISHMGQVLVSGPGAFDYLQRLVTSDLRRGAEKGLGQYAHLCRDDGGVIDDIFIYPSAATHEFFVVVNSATHDKDVAWLRRHATPGVNVTDVEGRGALALQGPQALAIIRKTLAGVAELPRFAFQRISGRSPADSYWGCRTGYTGEDGAEFFGPARTIELLFKQFLEAGSALGLKPCGLGARDTLRLEMGYPLYGNELSETRTPLEAGLDWVVKWDKGPFVGREALEQQKRRGLKERLLAYQLLDRGVPRAGTTLYKEGVSGGLTTSGSFSPSLQKGIGLAYAPVSWNNPGTVLEADLYGKRVRAEVVSLPFYRKPA